MGDVTHNFSRWEWSCKCGCGFDDLHPYVVVGIQEIRDALGVAVEITSGCRCPAHNFAEGGAPFSRHLPGLARYGRAVDFTTEEPDLWAMYRAAIRVPEFNRSGIGIYVGGGWVHVDIGRDCPARWGYVEGEKVLFSTVLEIIGG